MLQWLPSGVYCEVQLILEWYGIGTVRLRMRHTGTISIAAAPVGALPLRYILSHTLAWVGTLVPQYPLYACWVGTLVPPIRLSGTPVPLTACLGRPRWHVAVLGSTALAVQGVAAHVQLLGERRAAACQERQGLGGHAAGAPLSAACLLLLPLLCAPALLSLLFADEFSTGSVFAFSLRQSRSAAAGCGCDV